MKLNQKGIAHVGLIALAVVIVGVIGFTAYRVGTKNKESTKQTNTEAITEAKNDNSANLKKKIYSFEKTPLKMDIPESWQAVIDSKESYGYRGHLAGSNGWGVHFIADQGGYGGGPGCNFEGHDPDGPPCATWTVVSSDKLPTGDFLIGYASSNAGKIEGQSNCTIVDKVETQGIVSQKVGTSFVSDNWTCFGVIEANPNPTDGTDIGDTPISLRMEVIFPYGLDKKVSTDYTKDAGYKEVIEALKTLRKN